MTPTITRRSLDMGRVTGDRDTYDPDREREIARYYLAPFANGRRCFLCDVVLPDVAVTPSVMWSETTADIYLHAARATRLARRLDADTDPASDAADEFATQREVLS